mmetsp:Transcript_57883/g.156142  ORF Transcript_57883/g.156142 Transcript_57883/m.156142 type:complete len:401 (-) Transcript_57883:126-1328(-)
MSHLASSLMLQASDSGSLRAILVRISFVACLALVYMVVSSGLITFNKYLMDESRCPFALFVALLHMSSCFCCNTALFKLRPDLYPSLTDEVLKVDIDQGLVLRILLPIACCFGAQLVLSNVALVHSSVAFLQMMKQSNVVLVYLFSLTLALEDFSWRRVAVLVFIVLATALTIRGEVRFSAFGCTIQGVSMLCESMKLTLQSYSLSSAGRRLDALTYVLLVSPMVLSVLGAMVLGLQVAWPSCPEALQLPPWHVVVQYKWLLIGNGMLAFAMNVSHALFIKNSSAITFILTGVVMKDVVIVSVASVVLGELLSGAQVLGFGMQLFGIFLWSMMKAAPQLSSLSAESRKAPVQWEAVESEGSDNGSSRKSDGGGENLSKASSESTMAPLDDDESQLSARGA